jgi:hypothetical protein
MAMKRVRRLRQLIPFWNMPSDPIKAVWWFLHWLLKLVVNFFWLPILGMVIFETVINWRAGGPFNGLVSGVVTLIVGFIVWAALFGALAIVNLTTDVKQVFSQASRRKQTLNQGNPYFSPFMDTDDVDNTDAQPEGKIVEGSITDLDEERRKRRQEQK